MGTRASPDREAPGSRAVLHVVTAARRRGAETFAVDLAAALDQRGWPSEVVALTDGDGLGVPVLGSSTLGASTLAALRRRAAGAALVVAHGSRTLPACAAALAGRPTPWVYRSIGDPVAWSGHGLRRLRTGLLLRRAAAVTALWPGAAAAVHELHGVPTDRVHTIPNGVPAARCPVPGPAERAAARARLGLPGDAPVVGYVGALSEEKRPGDAVDAVAALPGVHLLVAGDGPARDALAARADAAAPGRVHLLGVLDGPGEVLAAADAVVLPSRTEGMPGVLIEAGLAATGAVATDVGGVAEIVRDGETGALVPPGDVPALAAGLRRVLDDAAALGAAARRHCLAHFEIGPVADRWAALAGEVTGAVR